MAITVGDRVQAMINYMDEGKFDLALSDICIALDITSQRHYGKTLSSGERYKSFIKENIWMIVATGMNSLIAESIKLPFVHPEIKSDADGYCTLEQIVYHVMRCGLIHDTGENNKIVWNRSVPLAIDKDGSLQLSPSFIWGLALAVITCPVNKDERVGDTCWISTMTFKYLVNDLWGRRENIKTIIKSASGMEVEEQIATN